MRGQALSHCRNVVGIEALPNDLLIEQAMEQKLAMAEATNFLVRIREQGRKALV